MKKVRTLGLLALVALVFGAGLLIGLSKNVKPDQLKVYTNSGETVSVEFPDGNIYDYN